MAQTSEIATWWGRHRIPIDRVDLWTIGPLEILVGHYESVWQIHWRHTGSPNQPNSRSMGLSKVEVQKFLGNPQPPSATSPHFAAKLRSITIPAANPNEDLIFSPVLPEESLIFPISPATGGAPSINATAVLDPAENLYLGFQIPLFIRVETVAGQSPPRDACEIPLLPLIRTWGGTRPLSGELALTPHAPIQIGRWSEITPRLDVANIAVSIVNRGSDSIFIDRITIPCTRLALFHSSQTGFWCESLTLNADPDLESGPSADPTGIQPERSLPREAGTTTLVSHARQTPHESAALKGLANFRSTIGTSVENLFKERG